MNENLLIAADVYDYYRNLAYQLRLYAIFNENLSLINTRILSVVGETKSNTHTHTPKTCTYRVLRKFLFNLICTWIWFGAGLFLQFWILALICLNFENRLFVHSHFTWLNGKWKAKSEQLLVDFDCRLGIYRKFDCSTTWMWYVFKCERMSYEL